MGFIDKIIDTGKTFQLCTVHYDDLRVITKTLEIKRDIVRWKIGTEGDKPIYIGWPFEPEKLTTLNINNKIGVMVYPVWMRDAVYDPIGVTGNRWLEKVKSIAEESVVDSYLSQTASDEMRAVGSKRHLTGMEKATLPLSIAAAIMIIALSLSAAWSHYYG